MGKVGLCKYMYVQGLINILAVFSGVWGGGGWV
jgi:hypothetical protein